MEEDEEFGPSFDIKSAIQTLAHFARLYALANGIRETNTFDRLRALESESI